MLNTKTYDGHDFHCGQFRKYRTGRLTLTCSYLMIFWFSEPVKQAPCRVGYDRTIYHYSDECSSTWAAGLLMKVWTYDRRFGSWTRWDSRGPVLLCQIWRSLCLQNFKLFGCRGGMSEQGLALLGRNIKEDLALSVVHRRTTFRFWLTLWCHSGVPKTIWNKKFKIYELYKHLRVWKEQKMKILLTENLCLLVLLNEFLLHTETDETLLKLHSNSCSNLILSRLCHSVQQPVCVCVCLWVRVL